MARPESRAIGGYYAFPGHLLGHLKAHLEPEAEAERYEVEFSVADPCAGDGTAAAEICDHLKATALYACELEATRFAALQHRRGKGSVPYLNFHAEHGDAFALTWRRNKGTYDDRGGASLLYLNPPYDTDPEMGRLEQRWLARFASVLADHGILAFVAPFYALGASAETLAFEFEDVSCYRFPDSEYAAFRQVVVFAKKRPTLREPDLAVLSMVRAWARSTAGVPVLGDLSERGPYVVPGHRSTGFAEWQIAPLDVHAIIRDAAPWARTDRAGKLCPVTSVAPAPGDLLVRRYPLAMPPKPAHIAAGIAAGVFNGARVLPQSKGLPPIFVKGVFCKEYVSVEVKTNREGDPTGEIQVEKPRLVVTALDTSTSNYHTLVSSGERTGGRELAKFTLADLLDNYGRDLMRVMLTNCPVLHDHSKPEHHIPLPTFGRRLYRSQEAAVMAGVKLLSRKYAAERLAWCGDPDPQNVFGLGEIGTGKSFVSLAIAKACGARRVLVLCPPHLLQSWTDQAGYAVPDARVVVLSEIDDVDRFAAAEDGAMVIGLLSRETAKLGHAWASVAPTARNGKGALMRVCPKCGASAPTFDKDKDQGVELARTRARCSRKTWTPANAAGVLARDLALALLPTVPDLADVTQLLTSRGERRLAGAWGRRRRPWASVRPMLAGLVDRVVGLRISGAGADGADAAVIGLVASLDRAELTTAVARRLYEASLSDREGYGEGAKLRASARTLMLLLREPAALAAELEGLGVNDGGYARADQWAEWRKQKAHLEQHGKRAEYDPQFAREGGVLHWNKHPMGSADLAVLALRTLVKLSRWQVSPECGEPLYQAFPDPRRVPLMEYLLRRHRRFLDFFIGDESHEYANGDSAQGLAAHKLIMTGIPTILATGSSMNGYFKSYHANQWVMSSRYRAEFGRTELSASTRRYGYKKQLVEDRADGKVVAYGSNSDRVERSAREIGDAPGVLPLFLLQHPLRQAFTLHKADLDQELPPLREVIDRIEPSEEQFDRYLTLVAALRKAIKGDRFSERAGKLLGALAEIPSCLDRFTADLTGATFDVAYPASVGGDLVASVPSLPRSELLPKERRMIEIARTALSKDRRVLIFAWHSECGIFERYKRLIEEHTGEPAIYMDADKVKASDREGWIKANVLGESVERTVRGKAKKIPGKTHRVLLLNPVAVQTGLNCLTEFSEAILMENPGCRPVVYDQGPVGRLFRLGQVREVTVHSLVYERTLQVKLHELMMHKVGVIRGSMGLDATAALAQAGVGESTDFSAFSVGKVLYDILEQGGEPSSGPRVGARGERRRAA